ncbi:MAG: hypothetical protein LBB26_03425 [Puniceicoccales bacterium]|jgi:FtsH-binding integral membrane protein|nr:hypothetical protein [Puniceicoccales bacterium]
MVSSNPVLAPLDSQRDLKPNAKQMEERTESGVAIGGIVGLVIMGIVTCSAAAMALTPFGLLFAIGISFVAFIACAVIGYNVAQKLDVILGFLGWPPKV